MTKSELENKIAVLLGTDCRGNDLWQASNGAERSGQNDGHCKKHGKAYGMSGSWAPLRWSGNGSRSSSRFR
jgi:hypothetical protein